MALPLLLGQIPGAFTPAPSRQPRTVTRTRPLDYETLLKGDLDLQGLLGSIEAQRAQGKIGYEGNIRDALIRYGGVPAGYDTNQLTRDQAAESTASGFSTLARLRDAYLRNSSASLGSLIGRGLGQSGAVLQYGRRNLHDYQLSQADAQTQLLGSLAQLAQGQQTQQGELAQQGYTATSDALNRIIGQVNAGLLAPQQVTSTVAPVRPNPAAPTQVQTPQPVGSQTSYEPKPVAGNYLPKPVAAPSFTPTLGGRRGPYAQKRI